MAYLSGNRLSAGEIAEKFDMSKPSISKHLSILENAELIESSKEGQFIYYQLKQEKLANNSNGLTFFLASYLFFSSFHLM